MLKLHNASEKTVHLFTVDRQATMKAQYTTNFSLDTGQSDVGSGSS